MGSSPNSPLRAPLLLTFRVLPLALATGLFLSVPKMLRHLGLKDSCNIHLNFLPLARISKCQIRC